ncbi:MAG: hypothetical protein U9M90_01995 [Patescibacteria group bacterium]|nr:hypothetical protein [Patescibacteria group bacterium]
MLHLAIDRAVSQLTPCLPCLPAGRRQAGAGRRQAGQAGVHEQRGKQSLDN